MSTLNELIYDCLSSLSGTSYISEDISISTDLIAYKIVNARAMLIRQDQSKGRSVSDNIVQTIPCIEVIQIDRSLCPCDIASSCTIYRTKNQIPKPLELHQSDMILKVSGVDIMSSGWSIISFARASIAGISSWTAKNTKVFLHNRYLYLINPPLGLSKISIDIVAEDPRDLINVSTCSGVPCWSADDEFPISGYMTLPLKELVLKDFGLFIQTPIDSTSNERYDKGQVKIKK